MTSKVDGTSIGSTGTVLNYILEIAWLKVYGVINFSAAYDLRHYQHVDRLLTTVDVYGRH